jgi:drug/metabolite transporter (DMT)-like permease
MLRVPSRLVVFATMMVVSNTLLTPITREIYATKAHDRSGKLRSFSNPFFLEYVMFLAMACVGLVDVAIHCRRRKIRTSLVQADLAGIPMLIASDATPLKTPGTRLRRELLLLTIPAALDFLGSWLIFAGLLWVPASAELMLGSAGTVFNAVIRWLFLKKPLRPKEVFAIVVLTCGCTLIGLSQLLESKASSIGLSNSLLIGVGLCLCAELAMAAENSVGEVLLQQSELSTYASVGAMGTYGVVAYVPIFAVLAATPNPPVSRRHFFQRVEPYPRPLPCSASLNLA